MSSTMLARRRAARNFGVQMNNVTAVLHEASSYLREGKLEPAETSLAIAERRLEPSSASDALVKMGRGAARSVGGMYADNSALARSLRTQVDGERTRQSIVTMTGGRSIMTGGRAEQ
ncbi:MAG: hypothetical protein KGH72_03395 [Candidatus Micrarchaeota archaeon]|nr:hypothetical protein [Candidatus Micrarchaeota archaeon]